MRSLNKIIKQNDFFDLFVAGEITMVLLALLSQSLLTSTLASLLHKMVYAVLFIYLIFRFYRIILIKQKLGAEFFVLMAFALISSAAVLASNASINDRLIPSFGFMKTLIFTNSALLLMCIASNSRVSLKTFKYIAFCVSIVTLIYVLMYVFMHDKAFNFGDNDEYPYLTLGLSNPNLTGLMLLLFFLTMVQGVFITNNRVFKLAYCVVIAILLFLLYKAGSRNSYISVCFFVFMFILGIWSRKTKFPNAVWIAFCFIPIAFVAVYMLIVENSAFNKLFSFMVSEGKNLNSREKVWRTAFEWIKTSPLLGTYYETAISLLSPAPHNAHLFIVSAFGAFSYVLFMFINCFTFVKANVGESKGLKLCAMLAVASTLLFGMAESGIFSGSMGLFMFLGLFIASIPTMNELPELKGYRLKISVEKRK